MKNTLRYVFGQLWHLIVLLIIAIFFSILGEAQDFAGAFFPQYMFFAFYVIAMGILSGFLGNRLPRTWNPLKWPFKAYKWEKEGKWYQQRLKINHWKDRVFDLSKAGVGTFEKKVSALTDACALAQLIQETCVAELTHWALILISPVMFLFLKPYWSGFFWISYVLFNLMDIVIQRNNRPRLLKLYEKMLKKEKKQKKMIF